MKRLYELLAKWRAGSASDAERKELSQLVRSRVMELRGKQEPTQDETTEINDLLQTDQDLEDERIRNVIAQTVESRLNQQAQNGNQNEGGDGTAVADPPDEGGQNGNSGEQRNQGQNGNGNTAIYNPEREIKVGEEVTPGWMRQVVNRINAAVMNGKGEYDKAQNYEATYKDAIKNKTQKQLQAEYRQAVDRINKSNLSAMAKNRAITTLGGGGGADLLPKPFLAEIFVIIEERGIARQIFRGVPMSSKDLDLKDVATKPVASWTNENADISESDASFGNQKLDTNKLAAITSWTNEMEEDEVFGLVSILQELFAESLMDKEDEAGFAGDGTASTGGFTGILNLSSAEVYTMNTGNTTSGDATADDYRTLIDQLSLARRRNARFYMHPDIVSSIEQLKDSQGQYIYRQPGDASRPATLWGYPITVSEKMPSSAAAGEKFVAFGDPNDMLFGTRRGVTLMTSREGVITSGSTVNFNALVNDGAILRITERIGFKAPIENAFAVMQTASS